MFGLADGTVNIGLGILNTSDAFQNVDYRDHLRRWMRETPEHWALREHADTVRIGGMALPMGFNRQPHYASGMLLVGDSGGMVNPFNGEGIDYALEAGALAGDAHRRRAGRSPGRRAARPSCTATPRTSRRTTAGTTRWAAGSCGPSGNPR